MMHGQRNIKFVTLISLLVVSLQLLQPPNVVSTIGSSSERSDINYSTVLVFEAVISL